MILVRCSPARLGHAPFGSRFQIEAAHERAGLLERSILTQMLCDPARTEPVAISSPTIVRILFVWIRRYEWRLLTRLTISAPFSFRFQIEAARESTGFPERSILL